VDFDFASMAPEILSIRSSSATKTSFKVSVQLQLKDSSSSSSSSSASQGRVVCGVYLSSLGVLVSDVNQIRYTGLMSDISGSYVEFEMSNLLPSSSYDVYCVSYSSTNVPLSLGRVLDLSYRFNTLCCREVKVSLISSSYPSNKDVSSVLEVRVDDGSSYPEDLMLTLSTSLVISNNGNNSDSDSGISNSNSSSSPTLSPSSSVSSLSLSSSLFSPSQVIFSKDGVVMRSRLVAYIRSSPGLYSLNVRLSGVSSSMYEVSYPFGRLVRVLGSEDQPSPPRVLSAIFSDSGSSITLSFDVSTNMGFLPNVFRCSRLLSFRGVDSIIFIIITSLCVEKQSYVGYLLNRRLRIESGRECDITVRSVESRM